MMDSPNISTAKASSLVSDRSQVGWENTILGELGTIYGGSTPSTRDPSYWDGDIAWLTPSDVTKARQLFVSRTARAITHQGLASCAAKVLPPGTLMMTSRATIGEVAIAAKPMATNQGFINVVCNQRRVHNEFLAYWIMQNRPAIEERAHGATFREISKSNFKTISILLPPLPEQRAIAHILRTVQDAVAVRRRELELERERKAALMQHLFTKGARGEPTKMTEIGEMPESWRVVQLGDVATISSGGTPDRTRQEYWNGDIPWVKTGEIDYNVIMQTEEHITRVGMQNSSARLVPSGTLLMAMYGQGVTRGRVAILGLDATLNQACAAIRTSSAVVTSFLYHYLAHGYERIRNLGHGANQKNLNALLIKSIVIPLPDADEQRAIADTLTVCDAKANALNRELALLEELFRALLEELMTARLSAVPLIETAATAVATNSEVPA